MRAHHELANSGYWRREFQGRRCPSCKATPSLQSSWRIRGNSNFDAGCEGWESLEWSFGFSGIWLGTKEIFRSERIVVSVFRLEELDAVKTEALSWTLQFQVRRTRMANR